MAPHGRGGWSLTFLSLLDNIGAVNNRFITKKIILKERKHKQIVKYLPRDNPAYTKLIKPYHYSRPSICIEFASTPECMDVIGVACSCDSIGKVWEGWLFLSVRLLLCVLVGLAALLPALLTIKVSQALNEIASGLVANHWCRKQINSAGLCFPCIALNRSTSLSECREGGTHKRDKR